VVGAFVDVSKSVTTDSPNVIVPGGGGKKKEGSNQSVVCTCKGNPPKAEQSVPAPQLDQFAFYAHNSPGQQLVFFESQFFVESNGWHVGGEHVQINAAAARRLG
jgi:hypothetical protein